MDGSFPHGPSPADKLVELFNTLYKPHPWHGVSPGTVDTLPDEILAFIESVPGDVLKYEIHKASGYLVVDRPHKFSSVCPSLYGFVPQTYCGKRVAERAMERNPSLGRIVGDGDPLDICVLSSRPIVHGNVLVRCRPIGGFRMIDGGEADDKLIAVILGDPSWGHFMELTDIPAPQLAMLKHYFLTYKGFVAGETSTRVVEIPETYDAAEAKHVLSLSIDDYVEKFGSVKLDFFRAFTDVLVRAYPTTASTPIASSPATVPTASMIRSNHLASYYYAAARSPSANSLGLEGIDELAPGQEPPAAPAPHTHVRH